MRSWINWRLSPRRLFSVLQTFFIHSDGGNISAARRQILEFFFNNGTVDEMKWIIKIILKGDLLNGWIAIKNRRENGARRRHTFENVSSRRALFVRSVHGLETSLFETPESVRSLHRQRAFK
jgi:hypothetical protein